MNFTGKVIEIKDARITLIFRIAVVVFFGRL